MKCNKIYLKKKKQIVRMWSHITQNIFFFHKNQLLQKKKLKQKTYNGALTIILCVLTEETKNGMWKL